MASKKPRLPVPMDPDLYETVRGLAGLQGRSMASVASEYLHMAGPVMKRLLAILQAASQADEATAREFAEVLQAKQGSLLPNLEEVEKQMDDLVDQAGRLGRGPQGRGPGDQA